MRLRVDQRRLAARLAIRHRVRNGYQMKPYFQRLLLSRQRPCCHRQRAWGQTSFVAVLQLSACRGAFFLSIIGFKKLCETSNSLPKTVGEAQRTGMQLSRLAQRAPCVSPDRSYRGGHAVRPRAAAQAATGIQLALRVAAAS